MRIVNFECLALQRAPACARRGVPLLRASFRHRRRPGQFLPAALGALGRFHLAAPPPQLRPGALPTGRLVEKKGPGSFSNGIYTREKPGGGKINQDAYEAVWEHVNGRELVYPKERYSNAIFMTPANFDWVQAGPGTATKLMGIFSERGSRLLFNRVDAGTRLALEDASLYFVCAGRAETGGKSCTPRTTIHVERGERGDLRATETTEVLQIGLPRFTQAAAERAAA